MDFKDGKISVNGFFDTYDGIFSFTCVAVALSKIVSLPATNQIVSQKKSLIFDFAPRNINILSLGMKEEEKDFFPTEKKLFVVDFDFLWPMAMAI